MGTEEKRANQNEFAGEGPAMSCCEGQDISEKMAECCESPGEAGGWCSMMGECMKGCRCFPLIPVMLGIGLFLLGYYLDAEITRILWMILSGLIILMGVFGFVMKSMISKK